MSLVYYGYYEMWSTFIPCLLSLVMILYLLGIKIYIEEYAPRIAAANDPLAARLGSALLAAGITRQEWPGCGEDSLIESRDSFAMHSSH